MRVAVSFGKTKIYTGLVFKLHQNLPELYEPKEIIQILDDSPIVTETQLKHWQWISEYYMCSLGEVYKSAVPSAFLLQSETVIYKNESFSSEELFNDEEFLIYEALQHQSQLTIHQVVEILSKKKVLPIIHDLIKKSAIYVKEEIYEVYKPKMVKYIRLHANYKGEESLENLLLQLSRAKKQRTVVISYFQLQSLNKPIKAKVLISTSGVSSAVIKALVDKNSFVFLRPHPLC